MNFTAEQENIFRFVKEGSGHGIIDAVAGAGKTTTIMQCAKYIGHKSALFCAFNNSIATEIRQKFSELQIVGVLTKTIHALGYSILKDNNKGGRPYQVDDGKYERLLKSEAFQKEALPYYKAIAEIHNLDSEALEGATQSFPIRNLLYDVNRRLLNIIQKARSILLKAQVEDFKQMTLHFNIFSTTDSKKNQFEEEIAAYYNIYRVLLKQGNAFSEKFRVIDFTDMIYLHYEWELMPSHKVDFLFIDECQDLSKAQLATAVKYGKKGTRVLSVGDPSQSIYGFTGADIESFDRIKRMTKAQPFPLTTCFRCPKAVIAIAQNIREDMQGSKDYEGLVETITRKKVLEIAQPGDLIISRIKAPLMELIFEFIKKEIKVSIHPDEVQEFIGDLIRIFKKEEAHTLIERVHGGFKWFKQQVLNRWRWIFQKNAERIRDAALQQSYLQQEERSLEAKLDFLHDRYIVWSDHVESVKEVIERIKEYITAEENAIRLSSIHRAKGLEEQRVFILDYDALPFQRPDQKAWERIQERNLRYVAVTRAKEQLYLVKAPEEEVEEAVALKDEGSLFDEMDF